MKLQTSGVLGTSYAIAKLAPKRVVNPHLPGGDQQLFIPDAVRDNAFKNLVQQTTLPW